MGRRGRHVIVEWQGIGRLEASADGEPIHFVPVPKVDHQFLEKFRATQLLACLRYLSGFLSLHGAAVSTPAGCLALVGESNAGKSTTAMYLVARGLGTFMTDDIVPIDWHEESPFVLPAADNFWLTGQSAVHFGFAPHGDAKRPYAPRARVSEPVPLQAIVELLFDDSLAEPEITRLRGVDTFVVLSGAHVCYAMENKVEAPAQLVARARLADAVPVFRLRRPRRLDALEGSCDALVARCSSWVR
jgi:hypothetical protein